VSYSQIQISLSWSITRHPGPIPHGGPTTGENYRSFRFETKIGEDFWPRRAVSICTFFVTGCSLRTQDPSRPFEHTRRAIFRVWRLWALFLLRGDSRSGPLPHMGKLHRGNAITRAPAVGLWRALRIAHPLSRKGSVYRTPDDSDDDAPRRGSVPARPGSFRGPGPCPSSHPSPGRCAGVNPGGQGWVRGRDRARVSHLPGRRRRDLRAGALLPPRGAHFRPLLRAGHRRNRPRALRGRWHRARVRPEQDSVRRDGRVRLRREGHGAQPRERQRRYRVLRQRHLHQRGRYRQAHRCVSTPDRQAHPGKNLPADPPIVQRAPRRFFYDPSGAPPSFARRTPAPDRDPSPTSPERSTQVLSSTCPSAAACSAASWTASATPSTARGPSAM
jgi:hypothetical protein